MMMMMMITHFQDMLKIKSKTNQMFKINIIFTKKKKHVSAIPRNETLYTLTLWLPFKSYDSALCILLNYS